jgi:hypothetical protein
MKPASVSNAAAQAAGRALDLLVNSVGLEGWTSTWCKQTRGTDGTGGHLGGSPNWGGGTAITAYYVDTIEVAGDLIGSITSARSVRSVSAENIYGDIIANDGHISTVQATNLIRGVIPGTNATISAPAVGIAATISSVSAKSIQVDISTASMLVGGGGQIYRVEATGTGNGEGYIKGSITSRSIGNVNTPTAYCISATGEVSADISSSGVLRSPVRVGSMSSQGKIRIGVNGDTGMPDLQTTNDIQVVGSMAGLIQVEGNKVGNVTISSGGLSGKIDVMGGISGDVTILGGMSSTGVIELDGSISSTGSILVSGGTMNGRILIGGSMAGAITLPANGLVGQVLINAKNTGGTWTGPIFVGSSVLSPSANVPLKAPNYQVTPSSLGGGSIGVLRLKIHNEGCTPPLPRSGAIPDSSRVDLISFVQTNSPIRIRYYGPIAIDSTNPPVTVYFGDPMDPDTWTDFTSYFSYSVGSDGKSLEIRKKTGKQVKDYRTITSSDSASVYFVLPVVPANYPTTTTPNRIYTPTSASLATSNIPVADDMYMFQFKMDCNNNMIQDLDELGVMMGMTCLDSYSASANGGAGGAGSDGIIDYCQLPSNQLTSRGLWVNSPSACTGTCVNLYPANFTGQGTFNSGGIASIDNIFIYLNKWFAGAGCADVDGSGTTAEVNIDDIFMFLNAWFGNCPCAIYQRQNPPNGIIRGCPCIDCANTDFPGTTIPEFRSCDTP